MAEIQVLIRRMTIELESNLGDIGQNDMKQRTKSINEFGLLLNIIVIKDANCDGLVLIIE